MIDRCIAPLVFLGTTFFIHSSLPTANHAFFDFYPLVGSQATFLFLIGNKSFIDKKSEMCLQ